MSHELDISRQRRDGGGVACLAYKPFDKPSVLKGWADLHIPGWHLRIMSCPASSNGDKRWVGLPGKPLTDRDGAPLRDEATGKQRWVAFAAFDDHDTLKRFSEAACAALDAYAPGWDRS